MTRFPMRRSSAAIALFAASVFSIGLMEVNVTRAPANPPAGEDLFGESKGAAKVAADGARPKPGAAAEKPATPGGAPSREPATAGEAGPRGEQPRGSSRELSDSEKRITQALRQRTNVSFSETELKDAVNVLSDQHDIPIVLDEKSLDAAGLAPDTPVTIEVKGVSLASGLRLMLGRLDLSYVISDEVLLITSSSVAESMTDIRVYRIDDLVKNEGDFDQLTQLVQTMFGERANVIAQARMPRGGSAFAPGGMPAGGGRFGAGAGRFSVGGAGGGRFAAGAVAAGPEGRPAAEANPSVIVPYRDLLLVRASQRTHEEIGRFLDEMRRELKN